MNPLPPELRRQLPQLACDSNGAVFDAPWQAQAFAMAVALHERGLFTWTEWAQALGRQIRCAPAGEAESAADAYFRQWLAALEEVLAAKQAAPPGDLLRYRDAWQNAADRTPHGQPLELQPRDFG